jgi:hypothetical protein
VIIVSLKGGLGNQMFQYATARRIAHKNCVPLKLDISWFGSSGQDTRRTYQLGNFNILEDFASNPEIESFKPVSRLGKVTAAARAKLFPKGNRLIQQNSLYFDPKILAVSGNACLEGDWGCEKYFLDIRDILKKEFTLRESLDADNEKAASEIRTVSSVSIHVRRGDFVTNPIARRFHGLCSIEYYRQAVKEIVCRVHDPHFFIFSDDHIWVKENLMLEYPSTVVCHNDTSKGNEDLWLMSLCKHNIIANSTFSWWGAWLNDNPGKTVVAPLRWLNMPDYDPRDMLPGSWIKL